MAIHLTEAAVQRIREQLAKRGKGIGLRIEVKRAGCSGYAYALDYADEIAPDELVFEIQEVKVVLKRDQLAYLEGLEVDFRREGLNASFKFYHPKAKATCGCGESFAF